MGVYYQAFADDVVLVFDGDSALAIERCANAALDQVRMWGIRNRLKFAPHKTCAMIVTRKLKHDTPRLSMGGVAIGMSDEMKLLGLTIDCKLTFDKHVANVCKKALNIYKQLARAARVGWGLHPKVIQTIYTAAVEPVILYAAGAWSPAASKLGIRRRLDSVQRGFSQKLCKAYRTVSLNSALVLAGILPLDLRIKEAAALYEAKKGFPRPELGDREVELMAPVIESPHPSLQSIILFGSLINQEQYNNSHHEVKIFTDGSKIEGKVGAAFSVWEEGIETRTIKLALPTYCSVYQAELLALYRAVEHVLGHKSRDFGIYSDSMSALQTISNLGSTHPLAVKLRNTLRRTKLQYKSVSLYWIKAHVGLEGNERADELAKEAALRSKKKPDYDRCPISFLKRIIRMETLRLWEERYKLGETAAITKLFFPSAKDAHRIIKKIEINGYITQIMTGHGGFSSYLSRFKCKEDPSCACEQGVEETVPHLIVSCPIFQQRRFDLEHEINTPITVENLQKIMISKNRDKFLKFCIEIVKKVIEKNKSD
ncbi:uncharacterized protein LOC125067543 [Vanessa atalanta]|uniref:uncharacterized protein LOC125067543 n=1 Tax=Vanessa atalanta TaxID=42275 RepID=UPI001FCD6EE5|nr:uncharacterized protein LOC125067543 [Vanessa atalanta]